MHLRSINYSAQAQRHFEWNFGVKSNFCRWKLLSYARYNAKTLGIDDIAYYQLERMLDLVDKGIDRIIITTEELMWITKRERDRVFKSNRMLTEGGLVEKIPRRKQIAGMTRVAANGYRIIMPPRARIEIESSLRPKPSRAELGMAIVDFRRDLAAPPGSRYGERRKSVLAARPELVKPTSPDQVYCSFLPHESSADPQYGGPGSDWGADYDPAPEVPTGWPDLVKRSALATPSGPIPKTKEAAVSSPAAPRPVLPRAEQRVPAKPEDGGAKTANPGFERISVVSREKRDFSEDRRMYFARSEEKKAHEAERLAASASKAATVETGPRNVPSQQPGAGMRRPREAEADAVSSAPAATAETDPAIRSEPSLELSETNQPRCSFQDHPSIRMEQAREGEGASGLEPDPLAPSGEAMVEPGP